MKGHYFLGIILSVISTAETIAQADFSGGARASALGNASVTLPDLWALHNNIAGIAGVDYPSVGVYADNRFGMRAFTTIALYAVYPTAKYGNYGVSFNRFGDELYSQQFAGIGASHKLGQFSTGVKIDLWQISVKGYGSQKAVALSVGGQGEIAPNLFFGAFAYNLNQARLASFEDERLPTIMKAGLSYKPISKVLLAIETEKSLDHKANFKAGIEHLILKEKFVLRTGFSTLTQQHTFGIGFSAQTLQIDYALGAATQLGISHHLSISYKLLNHEGKLSAIPQ